MTAPAQRRPAAGAQVSEPAAALVRLLSVTVQMVASFELYDKEPVLQGAVHDAVQALSGLDGTAMPGMAEEALDALAATVAELPPDYRP